jgi:PTH1 family peptidyl-tRNA hydrolase
MLLVVGLGNPGAEYARQRHNVGFMAVDAIRDRHGFPPWRAKFHGLVAEGSFGGRRVLVLKPMTYMNESGRAVAAAAAFHKIAPKDIVVFHDEIDLIAGKVRVKVGGGLAGHNGLRSIDAHIGPDFKRVRLGVGHPGHKDQVAGHVLKDFAKADRPWLEKLLDALADHFPDLAVGDDAAFMSKVAMALKPPRPKTSPEDAPARKTKRKEKTDDNHGL